MIQITVLNEDHVPQGPFNRAEIDRRIVAGDFTLNNLAHTEGFSDWVPLREVLARIDALPQRPVGSVILPPTAQRVSYVAPQAPKLVYAGFVRRFLAFLVDYFLVGALLTAVHKLLDDSLAFVAWDFFFFVFLFYLSSGAAVWLYFALLESSHSQATWGKRMFNLKVATLTGDRISFRCASIRFFTKVVSTLFLFSGYIVAAFTERRQALHDLVAGTVVLWGSE